MQHFVLVDRLRVANHLFSMGNYAQFVLETNRILEKVMKAKLENQMKAGSAKSERVNKLLQKLSPTGSLTRIPYSTLIGLFQKAGLFSSPTSDVIPFFTKETVDRMRRIRNRCEHEGYEVDKEEADWIRSSIDLILKEIDARSIISLQRKVIITEYEQRESEKILFRKDLIEKAVNVRLALSSMVGVEFEKVYDSDAPKIYDITVTYSVVGVYPTEEKIVVMVLIDTEYIHEDIWEDVIEDIAKEVHSSIDTVKGLKPEMIDIDIYDSYETIRQASL